MEALAAPAACGRINIFRCSSPTRNGPRQSVDHQGARPRVSRPGGPACGREGAPRNPGRAPQGDRLPRPHARRSIAIGARGDRVLRRREGPPRPSRLRRPHRQGRRHAGRGQSELGALQARSRARPRPDRRGAGYQREAMADRAPAGGGIRGRRRRARPPHPHLVRGRRREAVDLLVPGRGAAQIRGDATAFRARCSSAPRPPGGMCGSTTRSARGPMCSARSTRCSRAADDLSQHHHRRRRHARDIWRCRQRCRASSRSGR